MAKDQRLARFPVLPSASPVPAAVRGWRLGYASGRGFPGTIVPAAVPTAGTDGVVAFCRFLYQGVPSDAAVQAA